MVRTFGLPDSVDGTEADVRLARALVDAWRADGAFGIALNRWQVRRLEDAFEVSGRFFAMPTELKARCVSDLTYSGYLPGAGGEMFLACPDVPADDFRVRSQWACHGPVPWPGVEYRRTMRSLLSEFGQVGDTVLRLVALGLDLPDTDWLTEDGWHHLQARNGEPPCPDYGLLAVTAYDRKTVVVSPGEIMRFLTDGQLGSAPRSLPGHTIVYCHEPSFDSGIRPFVESPAFVHYGTHFTRAYMRTYPEREVTRRIRAEGRLLVLAGLTQRASVGA